MERDLLGHAANGTAVLPEPHRSGGRNGTGAAAACSTLEPPSSHPPLTPVVASLWRQFHLQAPKLQRYVGQRP